MKREVCLLGLGAIFVACAACGGDKGADTDATTDATSEAATTDDASTAGPGTETGTDSDTDTSGTTDDGLPVDVPARGGIYIERVEANQGIGVDIGLDGGPVPGSDRTAYLVQGRVTLIRAFWVIPDDWAPRKIEGRLTINFPDGTSEVKTNTATVEKDSFVGDLKRTFFWGLEVDRVVPGIRYQIELFEVEAGWEGIPEAGDIPPRAPYDGDAAVGIEDSYQRMKVMVVPFNYNSGDGCVTDLSNISEKARQRFFDYMLMMNPIDTLELSWHDALSFNQKISGLGQINQILVDLREAETPDSPELYYYGVIDPCSGGVGGAAGLANGIPTNTAKGNAFMRVSAGILRDFAASGENDDWLAINADTFVHEVGHSQGRRHVHCDGEAGTDPAYPNSTGEIGEWGWGVVDFNLKHDTVYKDYMTYCNPAWVSTYGWNKVYPVIKELSSWDFDDAAPDDGETPLLLGYLYKSGEVGWVTTTGAAPADHERSAVHHLTLKTDEGDLPLAPAAHDLDDGTLLLVAPLPDAAAFAAAESVTWTDDVAGVTRTLPAVELRASDYTR